MDQGNEGLWCDYWATVVKGTLGSYSTYSTMVAEYRQLTYAESAVVMHNIHHMVHFTPLPAETIAQMKQVSVLSTKLIKLRTNTHSAGHYILCTRHVEAKLRHTSTEPPWRDTAVQI